jgi:hypothetical protein
MIEDTAPYRFRRSRYSARVRLWCVVLILSGIAVGLAWHVWLPGSNGLKFTLQTVPAQTVAEGELITVQFGPRWFQSKPVELTYHLLAGPAGASIDSRTGRWQWKPAETDGGQRYLVKVNASFLDQSGPRATGQFSLTVSENHQRPRVDFIEDQFVTVGETLEFVVPAEDPDVPVSPLEFRLGKTAPSDATIDLNTGSLRWTPQTQFADQLISIPVIISKPTDSCSVTTQVLVSVFGDEETPNFQRPRGRRDFASRPAEPAPAMPTPSAPQSVAAMPELLEACAKLHAMGTLATPAAYPILRQHFAEQFIRRQAATINTVASGDDRKLETWLNQHSDLRDELYTAFGPEDDVAAGLKILQRLCAKKSTTSLVTYFELAIATAVTWDRESAIYDYTRQQRRSHAVATTDKLCDAVGNFDFYSAAATPAERSTKQLPWEFLIHVINHRTPLEERRWAWQTYADKRTLVGRCYDDVQYDTEMIKSGEKTSNLAGKPYTLPNLKSQGGICVMQADFAARVSKSLGIPAAYVEGQARTGVGHAWVMWTELEAAGNSSVAFSLESHGRYFIDRYYVGHLLEPQSGRYLTDRELELRLEAVGLDPQAYRQAKLIMQVWPELKAHLKLTSSQELDFLESVTVLNPGCQAAWKAIAAFARSTLAEPLMKPRLVALRERCFKTFVNCPDFLCVITDDLLAYEPDLAQRVLQYERLLQLWTNSGRRDLACRIRGLIADQQVQAGQFDAAMGGLAQTIKRFPDEGRSLPRLLDQYESIAEKMPEGQAKVIKLYQDLLPLIPRRRQGQTSLFYLEMLARTARYLERAGQAKAAKMYLDQLKKLQAGS